MYQTGDLLWIPAGTLLQRPKILGKDDLFSNYHQTRKPYLALFLEHVSHEYCNIILDGESWKVETRGINHSTLEEENAS